MKLSITIVGVFLIIVFLAPFKTSTSAPSTSILIRSILSLIFNESKVLNSNSPFLFLVNDAAPILSGVYVCSIAFDFLSDSPKLYGIILSSSLFNSIFFLRISNVAGSGSNE